MPYRYAWIALAALIPFVGLAFWPGYFSSFTTAPLAFHVHGLTACLWLALLIAQSWSIHNGAAALHRAAGKLTFVIAPLFMIGGVMVLRTMSIATAGGDHPFYAIHGPRLGWLDIFAGAGFALFVFQALRHRRNVELHSRYMLATVLLLLSPIFARLFAGFVPWLRIQGPDDFHLFGVAVQYAQLLAGALAAALYLSAPRYGAPFAIAVVLTALQSLFFQWVGPMAWWRDVFALIGEVPLPAATGFALAAGVGVVFVGWTFPHRRVGKLAPAR